MVSLEEGIASLNGVSGLPSMESFISMLQQCKKEKNLAHAKLLHVHIRMYGLDAHHALGNHLIPVFLECGSMPDAHQVFRGLERRNEHAWTSLIQGYIENWDCQHAFILFQKMQEDGVPPSKYTYPALLKACSKMKCAVRGREIHMGVIKEGLERDPYVGNTLVDMYAKCGSLAEAQEVFDRLLVRDVVSWNALITGYAEHGLSQEALISFEQMQLMGVSPSSVTYISGLKACGSLGFIDMGQEMHSEIAKEGYERDSFVCSTLVDMYAKCGLLAEAQEVFDKLPVRDVVMWTALIAGYAEHGFNEDAENCLEQMQLEGVLPNAFSWNAAIMGHAEEGESDRALILYAQMQEQGLLPDTVTFVCILKACGITADLRSGKRYHAQLYSINGLRATEVVVLNALIDMYGKCGNMVDAQHVFNAVPTQDLVRWSALIMGYVSQGEFELVFYLLKRLRVEGIQPDGITLLSVLAVCSHAGLVDEGWRCFEGMSKEYDVVPALTHYNCMLDLLGRAGQLDEALAMMQKMPFQPNLVTWSVLLGACQKWGNVELGRQAFDHAVTMDKNHASAFILMSNIFMDVPIRRDENNEYEHPA